tara:strand:- start:1599 stop:2924 length:1326 start_codon:yes stop_codon:yes gene_type:complete
MRLLYILIFSILLQSCSFDNKSGIWKNENEVLVQKNDPLSNFESLSYVEEQFDKIVPFDGNSKIKISNTVSNLKWSDIFYNKINNFDNFKYNNLNKLLFKSKKLSRFDTSENILYEENNIILNDSKGNLIIYSIDEKKIISKFNFYKKRYKKLNKKINFIVENNIIYVADNLGYLYSYNYSINKILWAKNYKIPFRSNLKIYNKQLALADQANTLYLFNKENGEILKKFPSEEITVKNRFINNLALNNKNLFFLNTYGTLYSFNIDHSNINWFLNLNQSTDLTPSESFDGTRIINYDKKLIITSNNFLYIIDEDNGSIIFKINFTSSISPVVNNNYLFIISKNDLLIVLDIEKGKIKYSYDINQKIADYYETKKRNALFRNLLLLNDKIFIFLNNSFVLNFDIIGNLNDIKKLPTKINSNPIIIDGSIIYLDKKNRLSIVD